MGRICARRTPFLAWTVIVRSLKFFELARVDTALLCRVQEEREAKGAATVPGTESRAVLSAGG